MPRQMLKPISTSRSSAKGSVPKITAAARAMRDVKPRSRLQKGKIFLRQLIEMHDNPAIIDDRALEHHHERGLARAAIVH